MSGPAFQFYASDFLADENVVLMSNAELGCYIKLLCFCWREGSIPADPVKQSKLCGEDPINGVAMATLWPCFSPATNDPTRMVHPRLEKERAKQENYAKTCSESGKRGAKARWNKGLGNKWGGYSDPIATPMATPMAKNGSSSSSSIYKANTKTRLPEDFEISEAVRDWAIALGITSLDRHLVHFRDIALAKDYRYVDWDRAFMRAIRDNWAKVPTPPRPSTRVAL